jgi:hypothetical protein
MFWNEACEDLNLSRSTCEKFALAPVCMRSNTGVGQALPDAGPDWRRRQHGVQEALKSVHIMLAISASVCKWQGKL